MVLEDVARIGPMLVLGGMTLGWIGDAVRPAGGHGFLVDLCIALAGSLIVGGIVMGSISTVLGMTAMLSIGGGGAALALIFQRTLSPSGRAGT